MHQNAEPRLRGVDWLARLLYANMQITTPSIIPILRDIKYVILNMKESALQILNTKYYKLRKNIQYLYLVIGTKISSTYLMLR